MYNSIKSDRLDSNLCCSPFVLSFLSLCICHWPGRGVVSVKLKSSVLEEILSQWLRDAVMCVCVQAPFHQNTDPHTGAASFTNTHLFWINGPNCQLRLDWLCLFNDREAWVFISARLSSVIDLTAIRCYFIDSEWFPWPWSWILKSYRLTGSGYDVFSKTPAASVQIYLTPQTKAWVVVTRSGNYIARLHTSWWVRISESISAKGRRLE